MMEVLTKVETRNIRATAKGLGGALFELSIGDTEDGQAANAIRIKTQKMPKTKTIMTEMDKVQQEEGNTNPNEIKLKHKWDKEQKQGEENKPVRLRNHRKPKRKTRKEVAKEEKDDAMHKKIRQHATKLQMDQKKRLEDIMEVMVYSNNLMCPICRLKPEKRAQIPKEHRGMPRAERRGTKDNRPRNRTCPNCRRRATTMATVENPGENINISENRHMEMDVWAWPEKDIGECQLQ
jgi:hypothetical protein